MLSRGPEAGMYRPQHLRFIFEQDSEGRVVRSDDGRRLVAAVERISGGVVIETTPARSATDEQISEKASLPTSADVFVSESSKAPEA